MVKSVEKVLLVVPAYNEQESILSTYQAICAARKNYDVIVINDGSTDDTEKILRENDIPHIELVQNLGIGGAVQTGYKYALENDYDVAVQFDGDGQHEIESVADLIRPIIDGEADMVIGSRFVDKNSDNFRSSRARRAGIKTLSKIIKWKTGKKIYDTTSGFRAAGRKVIRLFSEEYSIEYPEPISTTLAILNGLRVLEVPAKMKSRAGGKSSISGIHVDMYYMVNVFLCILVLRRKK